MSKRAIGLMMTLVISAPNAFAKKAVFENAACTVTTSFKSGSRACKSGKFTAKTIHECKYRRMKKFGGTGRAWVVHKTYTCSSVDSKKGIYLGGCDGQNTGYKSLKEESGDSGYAGKTLYRCKAGTQKEKRECEGRRGDSHDDERVAIFGNTCRGAHVSDKNNLSKVGKCNGGKLLVECKNKCVKRSGLKCTERAWTQMKSLACESSTGPRLEVKQCSPSEQATSKG